MYFFIFGIFKVKRKTYKIEIWESSGNRFINYLFIERSINYFDIIRMFILD